VGSGDVPGAHLHDRPFPAAGPRSRRLNMSDRNETAFHGLIRSFPFPPVSFGAVMPLFFLDLFQSRLSTLPHLKESIYLLSILL
jgi:hypothetical protein